MKNFLRSLILPLLGLFLPLFAVADEALDTLSNGQQTADNRQRTTDDGQQTTDDGQLSPKALRLFIDADAFIVDNEFDGPMAKGYTLPGTWIAPRLAYDPHAAVHLEAGLYAIFFNGADRYPSYAFHDIASWKGAQYRKGIHALPWFRADARIGQATFTLGTLHREPKDASQLAPHALAQPLYNPESLHSADPEMGAQVRLALPRYDLDLWIDWQSFIYKQDTHQEAFTAGLVQEVGLFSSARRNVSLTLPIQILAQHRGGEIDATDCGAQTLANAALGLRAQWLPDRRVLTGLGAEAMVLHSMQLKGTLWPQNSGDALWAQASALLWNRLEARAGYLFGYHYVSLFGTPHLSTLSTVDGRQFSHVNTATYRVAYRQPFSHDMSLTASVDGYLAHPSGEPFSHSLSLGLSFRAGLDFLLKRF